MSANDDHEEMPEQPADEQNEPDESALPVGEATIPCPQCGLPVSPHARRCPHCQQVITATMPIARPEKAIATESGAAWVEAASQIADLGAIPWEGEVHPVNVDTHPLVNEPVPLLSEYGEAEDDIPPPAVVPVDLPPPRPPRRWIAVGGAMFFLLALLGIILLVAHQQQRAAELAAEATHEAAQVGGSTTGTGQDQFTPPPSPVFTYPPTTAAYRSPTPTVIPTTTNTATPPPESTNTPTPYPTPTPLPVRNAAINAGSTAGAGYFSNDILFEGGNVAQTTVPIDTSMVEDPAPMQVYQSCRYGQFGYFFSQLVPGAKYLIRLHFADFMYKSAGQRVFNVQINGTTVLGGFDVVQQAGGPDIALEEEFIIPADPNGMITIYFISSRASQAEVNGLELYKVGG